jgi:chorismate-pyruvate lyase
MKEAPPQGPDLRTLLRLFGPSAQVIARAEIIPGDMVPSPYHDLLVHEHHMTVTVEAYHGDLVNVQILKRWVDGDFYARKILLTLQKTGKIVQFGIVRVDLSVCSPAVREEILGGRTPFGRILIKHNVLRRIEPTAYLRLAPGPEMMQFFGLDRPRPIYGRLARIHYNGQPAVELLEVVAPE